MIEVTIRHAPTRYPVRVEPGLLSRAGRELYSLARGRRLLVVTDRNVARLHGSSFLASLRRAGLDAETIALPPGERSKTLETVRRICARWAKHRADRGALVVALGGGVVSDVAGFSAASYARGLDWVVFPTTLLAQADASIGGKVGVNLPSGKNLLGAFHQPKAVFSDPRVLATLPSRAFRSGLAEIAKMGVIRRPSLLARLDRVARQERLGDADELAALIAACAREKAWYVSRDERDSGVRQHLNFGHTVGHALEAAYGYRRYTHGEAVSLGMAAALRVSVLLAGLDPISAQDAEALLRRLGLPTRLDRAPGPEFWEALARDKKRGRTALRMVLSPAIGAAYSHELPSLTALRHAVSSLVQKP